MKEIRILIVDDHHIVRKGLKLLFESVPEFKVIGDFNSAKEALIFLSSNSVDVLVTDITMPEMNGIQLVKEALELQSTIQALVMSMHLDSSYIEEALEAGAKGYVLKESDEREIIAAIKTVYTGQLYLVKPVSDLMAKTYVFSKKQTRIDEETKLTKREKEILKHVVNGLSNKMIAGELNISELTVNAHRYNLMKKINAKNSADLVRLSIEKRLV